jgi:hypothetical protein
VVGIVYTIIMLAGLTIISMREIRWWILTAKFTIVIIAGLIERKRERSEPRFEDRRLRRQSDNLVKSYFTDDYKSQCTGLSWTCLCTVDIRSDDYEYGTDTQHVTVAKVAGEQNDWERLQLFIDFNILFCSCTCLLWRDGHCQCRHIETIIGISKCDEYWKVSVELWISFIKLILVYTYNTTVYANCIDHTKYASNGA